MITNLRPRILNKEASPSVIRNTEMLDAVNIVADGLETSEQNTVKKIPGTIDVFFNDFDNAFLDTVLGVGVNRTAVVLGHCVDKERNRVFYFTNEYKTSDGSPGSAGRIYMMEQFSPDEIKIVILGLIEDVFPEDFVAADIIRIPVLEEEYNVDENFSGVQEDQDTIIAFDDSVDITDIQGEITVISTPSFPTLVVNPNLPPPSTTAFLKIKNTGGATAYNTFFEFGEGISSEDPQDHGRIDIFIGQENVPELLPEQEFTLPINISTEDGVEAGSYDFYVNVISQNYTQVIPVQFTLAVAVLEVVPPAIRFFVGGPGATSFVVGEEPQVFLGPIVENSGTVSEATFTFTKAEPPSGAVTSPLTINFSVGPAQSAVTPIISANDTVGSELVSGSVSGTLTEPGDVMEFKLRLRDDNGSFEDTYTLPINFSSPADVISFSSEDSELYDGFSMSLSVLVNEEIIVTPADIQTVGFSNQNALLQPNLIDDEIQAEGRANNAAPSGSSVILTLGSIYNNGDEDGHFFLNLRGSLQGFGVDQLLSMNRIGLRYRIGNSGPFKQLFSIDTIYNALPGIDDGFPTGADIDQYSETMAGGNSQLLQVKIENIDSSCKAGILDTVGETYEDDVLVNLNSAIGAIGILDTLRIEVHEIPSSDTILADLGGEAYNNAGINNASVKGHLDINTTVSPSEPIIGPTVVESRARQTTAQLETIPGGPLGGGLTTYYPRQYSSIFTDPNQFLLNDIIEGDSPVFSGNVNFGEGVSFAIVNTTVAVPGTDANVSANVSCTFQEPNIFGALGSGLEYHDPNPFQSLPFDIGSLGPVLVYTDPYTIGEIDIDDDDLSNYVNTAYSETLAYANNASSHASYGACRQFFINVPAQSVVFVAIKPEFSSYMNAVEQNLSNYAYAFDDEYYGSFCNFRVSVGGNTSNPGNINNRIAFPFSSEQWDWIHAQPDFGGAPPQVSRFAVNTPTPRPGFNDESLRQVVARPSFKDSSEVASLTSSPKKIVKKSASLNRTKRRGYGK